VIARYYYYLMPEQRDVQWYMSYWCLKCNASYGPPGCPGCGFQVPGPPPEEHRK